MPPKKIKKDQSKHDNSELELVNIEFDYDLKRHEMRMEELKFVRENEVINHDHALERMRIKSAEIRKSQNRRIASQYPRGDRY